MYFILCGKLLFFKFVFMIFGLKFDKYVYLGKLCFVIVFVVVKGWLVESKNYCE